MVTYEQINISEVPMFFGDTYQLFYIEVLLSARANIFSCYPRYHC